MKKETDKYENAHTKVVAVLSRRRDREPSILRTFCKLKACIHLKRQNKAGNESVRIQSVLCKVASEQNSCVFEHLSCVQN